MIRHAVAEGWQLLCQRGGVSLVLALALAVPVGGGGVGLTLIRGLGPMAELEGGVSTVAVLLHPRLDAEQRRRWIEEEARARPDWRITEVSSWELAERLRRWFPYLDELLSSDGASLPVLLEIETSAPETVAELEGRAEVLAVGPRSSVQRLLGQAARRLGWSVAALCAVLMAGAALLAAVWVHLELYRHADELTIMRLVGATEGTVRGPFLVAVAIPGLAAGLLSMVGTWAAVRSLSGVQALLGLPPLAVSPLVLGLQLVVALGLPLAAALATLARHAADDIGA